MADTLSSAAQNFASFANGGVDPRTGLYSFTLNLPVAPANNLAGPELDLRLSFNPLGGDDFGFGQGWAPNLSRLSRHSPRVLALSTGERFHLASSGSEPLLPERKLQSFRFWLDDESHARVIHRDGRIEHLTWPGFGDHLLPALIEGPNGRWVKLDYALEAGVARLARITDEEDRELLRITKTDGLLMFYPQRDDPSFFFRMSFISGRLETLALPGSIGGQWRFSYYNNDTYPSITQVTQPLGAVEQIAYEGVHQVPGGRPALPRVTRHTVAPGAGQPAVVYSYLYDDNGNNFLGYNAITRWPDDGSDPLYALRSDYTYAVTAVQEANGKRRTVRRQYNRFHWQLSEITQQGSSRLTRTTLFTDYASKTFAELPDTCQLATGTLTEWYDTQTTQKREERTTSEYDAVGNLLRQVDASGVIIEYSWYDAAEQDGCPADPWGFVRHMKSMIRRPGNADERQGILAGAGEQVTTYRYCALPLPAQTPASRSRKILDLPDVNAYIVIQQETILPRGSQGPADVTAYEYHDDSAEPTSFGRLKRQVQRFNGFETSQTYSYTLSDEEHLQTTLELTTSDGIAASSEVQQSLSSGQTVFTRDPLKVETRSTYDGLKRLSTLSIFPNPAQRRFGYRLWNDGEPARQINTNAAGISEHNVLDGLGKAVEQYVQLPGQSEDTAQVVWRAEYDAFGQLYRETTYDNCGEGDAIVSLTTTFDYDDWGQLATTQEPDGVLQTSDTNPIGPFGQVTRSWRSLAAQTPADGVAEVVYNRLGLPWESRLFSNDHTTLRQRTRHYYDGFGQQLREELWYKDFEGKEQTRVTAYRYDGWGRLTETRLPNGERIDQRYAKHSTEALVSQVGYAAADASIISPLAERQFDLLGRVTRVTQGGRSSNYAYEGAQPLPTTLTRADGSELTFTYTPALTTAPTTVKSNSQGYRYDFHPVTGLLEEAAPNEPGNGIDCHYTYNPLGQLVEEARESKAYITTLSHSLGGRRQTRGDSGLSEQQWRYDDFGRLKEGQIDQVHTHVEYDALGRVYRQCGAGITCEISYDDLGRESLRKLLRSSDETGLWTYQLTWNDDGTLAQRTTLAGDENRALLRERFEYDERNRLKRHRCTGEESWLPRDRFELPYKTQEFTLDPLDNVRSCVTTYADDRVGSSEFRYDKDDACQLASVLHIFADGSTQEEHFSYNQLGQLETRSSSGNEQSRFGYDSLGRLQTMTVGGEHSRYHYDPNGSLCVVERGGHTQRRFYDGYRIDHLRSDDRVTRYLASAAPVCIDDDGNATDVLTDSAGSAVGEWRETLLSRALYGTYGSLYQAEGTPSRLGFNGELREDIGDAYLLGNGYRLYDADLMRFIVPDNESPFGAGGLNPYCYAHGNPIMLHDPSGHAAMPIWDATNLPYYIEPDKPEGGGGNWLSTLFKAIGIGFLAYEGWSLISIVVGIVTAPVGGVTLAMAGAAALTAASLGTGIAAMINPENDALMFATIGLGLLSGVAASKAGGMTAKASARQLGATSVTPRSTPRPSLSSIGSDLGSPYGDRFTINPLFDFTSIPRARADVQKLVPPPVPPKPRPKLVSTPGSRPPMITPDALKGVQLRNTAGPIPRPVAGSGNPLVDAIHGFGNARSSGLDMKTALASGRRAEQRSLAQNPGFNLRDASNKIEQVRRS
ncbi:hypothetical protein D1006_35050 [Burkholderia stabilis]|uniref:RHS repeat-associated core domain-containing protein n=1 Tax=Burkholderia stabilis TaxID=95485 RepID=A0A4Q2A7Y7_9BURK|nr:RHS repeat-associated core domain-containing protein [Burkholderia stabilis]RXV65323.1 hypothetical protein D1006_35050 [Burkholderia stabilis]